MPAGSRRSMLASSAKEVRCKAGAAHATVIVGNFVLIVGLKPFCVWAEEEKNEVTEAVETRIDTERGGMI